MWCGSASEDCLLPMVIYKAKIYEPWVKSGLKGCIYNVTKSGWFHSAFFQQWFIEIFMKTVAEKPGKYVLLGDNLAMHFNLEIIKIAEQNDIYFAMLPPNAVHLLQPVDVCFFIDERIMEEISAGMKKRG